MTFSTFASPGVGLQGGGGSGGGGTASLPISGNGATITTSTPLINGTQTWNSGATTFTSLLLNVTDTASAAGSLLMDLQVGGISKANIAKGGRFYSDVATNATAAVSYALKTGVTTGFGGYYDSPALISSGAERLWANNSGVYIGTNIKIWLPTSTFITFNDDLFLTRRAAANLRLGAADAAAPVAQTLSVQSVVAGTTNTAGADLTITGSQGTGTGAGGSIVFQVAPAGTTGTAQNALATALTISSAGNISVGNAAIATTATDGFLYVPSCAGTPTGTPTTVTGRVPIVVDTTNNKLYFYSSAAWRDAGP